MSYIGNPIVTAAFVTDQFNGTGSQTAFTMSVAPANTASILVIVSGVTQSPDSYSINGLTLTFSAAPPTGTGNISVRYLGIPAAGIVNTAYRTVTEFTATVNQKTFTVPSYTTNFISVFKNGVRLGTADYTATDGVTVTLIIGAAAGDLVTTESFYVSSVLGAIPSIAGAVTNPLILDGAVSQSKLGTGVAGNGPAFSAYMSTALNVAQATWTKLTVNTKNFDTNNNFNISLYRFLPTVAGYYQINASTIAGPNGALQVANFAIYKNGAELSKTVQAWNANISWGVGLSLSEVIYFNGTTDYVELYGYIQDNGGGSYFGANSSTRFSGNLVRAV